MRRHRKLSKDKRLDTSHGWRLPNRGSPSSPSYSSGDEGGLRG